MRRFALILLTLAFIGVQAVNAQTRRITGTVTSAADGTTIPGVSVVAKGTSVGTITNLDGGYQLDVPESANTLVFSFVGMTTTELAITGSVVNLNMTTDIIGVDEVVVVGYGTTTRQSFVGSIKTIKSENIQAKSVANLSQSLAGEAAGVNVINTSGQPGTSSVVRIRGYGSVNGNRDPLYVLDGVPFSGALSSINPNDIETTTILKDATATAIYGSRGANGVILLTTKSGRAGTSIIEADIKTGVNVSGLPRYSTIKSPEEYIGLSWESKYNHGVALGQANPVAYANAQLFGAAGITPKYNMWNATAAELIDPETRTVRPGVTRRYDPERWEDYGFQSSSRTEGNLVFRGGNNTTKYFTSYGYLHDVGYIINSDFKRYTATMNVESIVKPWLTTSARMNYAGSETNNNGQSSDSGSIFWFVDNLPPIFPLFLRDDNGQIVKDPIFEGNQFDYGIGRAFGALTNSIADATFDKSRTNANQLTGNFSWNIRFHESLTFENTLGAQLYASKFNNLRNPFYGGSAGQGGYVFKTDQLLFSYNFLNLLRFKRSFGSHNLEALAAHESNSWERKIQNTSKSKMVHPDIDDLNNFIIVPAPPSGYTDQVRLESYFGQVNYNFDNKYFLSSSIRRDGTSRFIGDNKWDTFGSLGFSWVVTNENFMQGLTFVDFLKYKISYGVIGEQSGVGFYPGFNTFSIANLNDRISISPRDIGNPDLTWETSKMFQTGVEFGLGKYVTGSVDYYIKNTDNLVFERRVGPSVGYALLTVNDGLLRNSGVEFDLAAQIVNKSIFGFDVSINGEFLNNELLTMPIDPATNEPKILDIADLFGRAQGRSLFDFYMREWAGVDPADGRAMWYIHYHDANGNGAMDAGESIASLFEYLSENPDNKIDVTTTKTYATATQKYLDKSPIPIVRGGFRLNARVWNFDLSTQFVYSLGGYAYDGAYARLMSNDPVGNNNWHTDIFGRWQHPGDITDVPRLSDNFDTNVSSASSRFLTRADFLTLNNVRIGFNVPRSLVSKIGVGSLSIYGAGDNLFLLSSRDGFNPSTNEAGTSDMYRYSPLSTYTFGLRVTF